MAGTYADVPGYRMPYDRDGTVGYRIDTGGNLSQYSTGNLQTINDESNSAMFSYGNGNGYGSINLIFPEMRSLTHLYLASTTGGFNTSVTLGVAYSTNTTTGVDGDWTSLGSHAANIKNTNPTYRTDMVALAVASMRGIKFSFPFLGSAIINYFNAIHLYGQTLPTTDFLRIWHPTLDQEVGPAYFDWGDIVRGSVAQRSFRVKNLNTASTANGVVLLANALTDTGYATNHTFSSNGGSSYAATVNIGNLLPLQVSGEMIVKRTISTTGTLGAQACRIIADPTTWT